MAWIPSWRPVFWDNLFGSKEGIRIVYENFSSLLDGDPDVGVSEKERIRALVKRTQLDEKTIRKVLNRVDETYSRHTIDCLAAALGQPAYTFIEDDLDAPGDPRVEAAKAVVEHTKAGGVSPSTLRDFLGQALDLLGGVWTLVHWSTRVADPRRRFRRAFKGSFVAGHWACVEVTFEGTEFEAILTYRKRVGPVEFMVDYGLVGRTEDTCRSQSLFSSERTTGRPTGPGRLIFATWADGNVEDFMIRSETPFQIRLSEDLADDEGDRLMDDRDQELVGFPRWIFHRNLQKQVAVRP